MTAAIEGGEWSAARLSRILPPGKNRYPFYRRLGGPQVRSGRAENLVPTGIRSRIVQPVVSRYTDWATRPTLPLFSIIIIKISQARYKVLRVAMLKSQFFLYATCQLKCCYRYFKRFYLLPLTSVSSSLRAGPLDNESEGWTIVRNVLKYTHSRHNVSSRSNQISCRCLPAKILYPLLRNKLCPHFFLGHFR